jgi:hypothetical protein
MTRDEMLFALWNTAVLGLAALAIVLGYAEPVLHSGREVAVAVMGGLYALGVALSAIRIRQFARGVAQDDAEHQLDGIALVGELVFYVGLLGTVGGMASGLIGFGAATDQAAGAPILLGGVGLGLSSMFVGVALNMALTIGARFVANVAHNHD